jgi:hypothetical protein
MKIESAVAQREHDFTGTNVFRQAACDLNRVARPKIRQHAFTVHPQAQPSAGAQTVCRQQNAVCLTAILRAVWRRIQNQEVFREELHIADVPASLPHERAAVSKTRSHRNAGLWYGFFWPLNFSAMRVCFSKGVWSSIVISRA